MGKHRGIYLILTSVVMALLLVAVACGDEDTATPRATSTSESAVPTATTAADQPTSTSPSPTATTVAPPAMMKPEGRLNVATFDLGQPLFAPWLNGSPMNKQFAGFDFTEALFELSDEGFTEGRLVKEWSVSDDGLVWTFGLQEGVKWHKGYGEWNAEDLLWNHKEMGRDGSIYASGPSTTDLYFHEDGWQEVVDNLTVNVHTGVPRYDAIHSSVQPVGDFASIYSKAVFDALGDAAAEKIPVASGPFELMEFIADEVFKFQAVEDHWRITPAFAEMYVFEIPEESTQMANLLTGAVDTTELTIEGLQGLEGEGDFRFHRYPGLMLRIFMAGNIYPVTGREPHAMWEKKQADPDKYPWVSADPDVNSEEWARARNLRLAMAISIDREGMVRDFFDGEGVPAFHYGQLFGDKRWGEVGELSWEYDPDRARQLLTENGAPNGFDTIMCLCSGSSTSPRRVMGEIVADMWNAVGIRTAIETLPYSAVRGDMFSRGMEKHFISGNPSGFEPLRSWLLSYTYDTGWNGGAEHDFFEDKIYAASETVDSDARWLIMQEIGRFLFEEVLVLPVAFLNVLWPAGPKIEVWRQLGGFPASNHTNLASITHREQ